MTRPLHHEPVLVEEVMTTWVTDPRGWYLDGTVGGGGHAGVLLSRFPAAKLIGMDRDPAAIETAGKHLEPFGSRVRLEQADIAEMETVVGDTPVLGILLDLGVSAFQLDDPGRGFSHQREGPLHMALDRDAGRGVGDMLAEIEEDELRRVFRNLGELPGAGRAARAVLQARDRGRMKSTGDLVAALRRSGISSPRRLSQAFQALRLDLNQELPALKGALEAAARVLPPGGTLTVLSFESLMDRMVKQAFRPPRREHRPIPTVPDPDPVWNVLTPRVVRPGKDELDRNPRARSAKLRAGERTVYA